MAAPTSRRWLIAGVAGVAAIAIAAVLGWLYVRGGGPIAPQLSFLRPAATGSLDASPPAEQVLRTLRLVGVDRAVVGDRGGEAVVRIELPAADSSADVTVAWQGGLGALRSAYPSARRYVVQLFGEGAEPLVEMSWSGQDARATDDASQLRSRARVTLLSGGRR